MWYTVLFVISAARGNLESLSVSPGQMPYEDCKAYVDTRNGMLGSGAYTMPGYRSAYTCMDLQKLEALIAKYDCAAAGVDPEDNDILYECKSKARGPTIPLTTAPRAVTSKPSTRPLVDAPVTESAAIASEAQLWAVQAGTFSSRASAEKLTSTLVKAGQPAFVMPVTSEKATLYRVRIGPYADRETANAALSSTREIVPGAAIVRHPSVARE